MGQDAPLLEDVTQRIEATEHLEFIKDICQYLILKREAKCNSVMIWGAYSAGKTEFLKRLGEIFQLECYF